MSEMSATQGILAQFVISPTPRGSILALSFIQHLMWFLAQMEGVGDTYHVPVSLRLRGALDHIILEKTLNKIYARHESLRSTFVVVDGEPTLKILSPESGLKLIISDLRQTPDRDSVAEAIASEEAMRSFDLEKGPLVRVQLIQLAEDDHILLLMMHHIVTDGWSMDVLFREMSELYMAYIHSKPDPLVPLSIQYQDYAAWQREWLTQDRFEDQAAFWRKALAGAPVSLTIPTDRHRPRQQSFVGGSVPIQIDPQLTSALHILCQKHRVTMFMVVLGAWSIVLSRLSGQDDIVIGTPVANRNHPQVEQLIGFFVNTLALRVDLSGDPNADQILDRVAKMTVEAQAHQDIPFEQVVEIIQPPRRMDQTPIFQAMIAWQSEDNVGLEIHGVEVCPCNIKYDVVNFDLDLSIGENNGNLSGSLSYSTALFDHETIERHVGYLEAILRWMTSGKDQSISEAPIVGPMEERLLLETWNDTNRLYPDNECIHRLFENQVSRAPEALAIVHDSRCITYYELNNRANWIAQRIVTAGVGYGDHVAIVIERSIDLVASQIAILKVGAAYVPIDPRSPVERQMYIVKDCAAKLVVTDQITSIPDKMELPILRLGRSETMEMSGMSLYELTIFLVLLMDA
ncbi:hypothetical protein BGW41_005537 [Actinomortierella wolfii]|nr:hypothetical protein BGW41_005537 [Actinomortierella wolfii]